MRRKHRNRLDIKIDMLKAISEGEALPTRIMYRANLSWVPMHRRLDEMLKEGLIEVATNGNPEGHRHYAITCKGRWVLRAYHELEEKGLS